jgi:2,3-diaminopropionate biosynthesis protein SbnA
MVSNQEKYLSNYKTSLMSKGILGTIGNTPLIELQQFLSYKHFQLFGKLEMFNPGGSIKDRPALKIIKQAFETGKINSETTIIESSSGNLGIGLAQICSFLNLHFICVIDLRTTTQNINILKAYGADIVLINNPDPVTGDFLPARIDRVKSLLTEIPNSFWCNQYSNLNNSYAHYQTMEEIITAFKGEQVDYLFCSTSTCGTLRGCSEYIKNNNLKTKVIAVDVEGSVIFGGKRSQRLIPGPGAARVPELYQPGLEDEHIYISDLDCIVGCRRLLRQEAILAGGSSGGVLTAIEKKRQEIPDGAICVAICCDRGERYLDTIYSDVWVEKHFGNVSHLWEN